VRPENPIASSTSAGERLQRLRLALSGSQDGRQRGIFSSMRIVGMAVLRQLVLALLVAVVVLPAAGCGRKAQPEPPPGADFPRTYPSR
jgi:hypothetical protein